MSQFRRAALAALAVAALAAVAPASRAAAPAQPGAKAITFPVPAKAPVVVQVNGIGNLREHFRATLKAAVPREAAEAEKQLHEALDQLLAGRKLTAIPKDGRAFLVVHDIAALFDNTLAVSVLVPVTSYKEFRDSFLTAEERKTFEAGKNGVDGVKLTAFGQERAVHLVDLKDYVAISPDEATAKAFTEKYAKATTAAMAPDLANAFRTADVSVYVNLGVINNLYGDQIRAFKGLIDFAFMQAGMGGVLPGMSKKQLEAAKNMLKGALQAVEDARGLVIGLEFRPEGVAVRAQAQFAEDTDSAALLKAETPGPLADVAKLPAGLGQYGGTRFGKKFAAAVAGLNPQFAPAEDDEKGNAAVDKFQKELVAAGLRGEVSAVGVPTLSLTVSSYAEPKKAAAALVGCYQAMKAGGRIQAAVLKEAPKVAEAARKHRGFTFTEIRLTFDFDATVKDIPAEMREATLAQLKRLVTEKMALWVGTDGQRVMQASAKDWDAAAKALDEYLDGKKGVGDTPGYKLTRKNLPPDASFLVLLETAQTATMMLDSFRSMSGAIPDLPRIGKPRPVKGEASFVGVAIALKGDVASFNLFIPGAAIATLQEMSKGLFRKVE
jgi:hypothetical protein